MMDTMNTASDQVDLTHLEQSAEERRRIAFGKDLASWRARKGLSIEEASLRAGITTKTYQRLEFGKPVRVDTIRAMDTLLALNPGESMRIYSGDLSLQQAIELNSEVRTDKDAPRLPLESKPPSHRPLSRRFFSMHSPTFGLDRGDVQDAEQKLIQIEEILTELPFPYLYTLEHIVRVVREARLRELEAEYEVLHREVERIDDARISAMVRVRQAESTITALKAELSQESSGQKKEVLHQALATANSALQMTRSHWLPPRG